MALVKANYYPLGGFWVFTLEGNKGDLHRFGSSRPVPRLNAAHREVCVAGSKRIIEAPAGAAPFPTITVGCNSDARPDLVPGTYVAECQEDGTKCVGVCGNRDDGVAFDYAWIDLRPGQSITIARGRVVGLAGDYELDNGTSRSGLSRFFASSRDVSLTAKTRTLGVAIWAA